MTKKLIEPPKGVNINVLKYQHLPQFILETNLLIVQLKGVCTKENLKMKATDDWLYLCSVHKETQESPVIDYMINNLNQMNANLNSSKLFPSRVNIDNSSIKETENIIRRLYRYFSIVIFIIN